MYELDMGSLKVTAPPAHSPYFRIKVQSAHISTVLSLQELVISSYFVDPPLFALLIYLGGPGMNQYNTLAHCIHVCLIFADFFAATWCAFGGSRGCGVGGLAGRSGCSPAGLHSASITLSLFWDRLAPLWPSCPRFFVAASFPLLLTVFCFPRMVALCML